MTCILVHSWSEDQNRKSAGLGVKTSRLQEVSLDVTLCFGVPGPSDPPSAPQESPTRFPPKQQNTKNKETSETAEKEEEGT